MRTRSSTRPAPIRFALTASVLAVIAAGAGGCSSLAGRDITGSISASNSTPASTSTTARSEADWRKDIDVYGARYRNDPKDSEAALRYGQALRGTGQRAQATAVL